MQTSTNADAIYIRVVYRHPRPPPPPPPKPKPRQFILGHWHIRAFSDDHWADRKERTLERKGWEGHCACSISPWEYRRIKAWLRNERKAGQKMWIKRPWRDHDSSYLCGRFPCLSQTVWFEQPSTRSRYVKLLDSFPPRLYEFRLHKDTQIDQHLIASLRRLNHMVVEGEEAIVLSLVKCKEAMMFRLSII